MSTKYPNVIWFAEPRELFETEQVIDSLMNTKATCKADISGKYMKYRGRSLRDHSTNGLCQSGTLHMSHKIGKVQYFALFKNKTEQSVGIT